MENFRLVLGESLAIAVLAYAGAILWLYEKPKAGAFMLYVIGAIGAVVWMTFHRPMPDPSAAVIRVQEYIRVGRR